MYFFHSKEIWQIFPALVPGVMWVTDVGDSVEVEPKLERWLKKAKARLAKGPESKFPEVLAWRQVYSQMGLKPSKYRSAAEALLRRLRREGDLPRLHPLVDLCNAVSVAFAIPVAVFDVDKIVGYLEVCKAQGSEKYLAFSGEVEHPNPGEIIFRDEEHNAHARRWTFRQSKLSTVGSNTTCAMIISEGMHEAAGHDVPTLLNALYGEMKALGYYPYPPVTLSADRARVDFSG